jgi:NADH-quinone oxidoreductase subunit N
VRVLISALGTQLATFRPILWVLVALTTLVGAGLAVVQRNVKRMLAYSSINHAGFMLLGIWAGTVRGTAATLFYVMTYAPIVVATFAVVTLVGGASDENHSIEHYRGLARRQPWLGAALAVLLLSQLGAPLTTGFYAKFAVLASAVDSGAGVLALVALVGAAIAAYFYLRWVLALYADDDADDDVDAARIAVPPSTGLVIGLGVVLTVVFGVWPGPLASLAQHATVLFTP